MHYEDILQEKKGALHVNCAKQSVQHKQLQLKLKKDLMVVDERHAMTLI